MLDAALRQWEFFNAVMWATLLWTFRLRNFNLRAEMHYNAGAADAADSDVDERLTLAEKQEITRANIRRVRAVQLPQERVNASQMPPPSLSETAHLWDDGAARLVDVDDAESAPYKPPPRLRGVCLGVPDVSRLRLLDGELVTLPSLTG